MILIKGGTIADPKQNTLKRADIVVEHNKIREIGIGFTESDYDEVIDAAGMIIAPGLIDVHVHFRDPGLTYKEDIITGAKAAKKGGFTTVITMANTKPVVDNVETLKYVMEKGKSTGIHVLPCACITLGMKGEKSTSMEELKEAGAVGFTDDGIPIMDKFLVKEAMEEAKRLNVPLSFHEEDPSFIGFSGVNEGAVSKKMGMKGAPAIAEEILVARDGLLALHTGAAVNIQHISSKHSVALVRMYKQMGANLYAEATPHHFSLDETAVLEHGALAKMNPPLRTAKDRDAIIEGLKDGTIDMIATDHAPHSKEEKEQEFTKAPSGIIGLETSLALGITNLVRKGHLSIPELMKKMSYMPAQLYHLDKGFIEAGQDADLVIFNPDEKIRFDTFESKADNTPFKGQELFGKVRYTICDGKIVYRV